MAQWVKGQSGNPGGRAKGIERVVREIVAAQKAVDPENGASDGWAQITLRLFELVMGKHGATPRDSIAAAKLLYERAYGQPKQHVKIEDGAAAGEPDWSALTVEQRRTLLDVYSRIGVVEPNDVEH